MESIEKAGYTPGLDFVLGSDAAASEFFDKKNQIYNIDGRKLNPDEMVDYYMEIIEDYPSLKTLEDPFDEDDFRSFSLLTKKTRGIQIVDDDLTVTNVNRLQQAIDTGAGNSLLLKVNQIGTLTEAIQAAELARSNGWGINISHRSGETEDTFIADLAVALGAERIKTGAPARGERTAKYNQLLRIEELLGNNAKYLGNK